MIETREALDSLDAILATPGIDGVFVGPNDLSIALHRGAVLDPHDGEVERALTSRRPRRRPWQIGRPVLPRRAARQGRGARGFALRSLSTDINLLRAAARAELAALR